jgi:DNA repair protein RadC
MEMNKREICEAAAAYLLEDIQRGPPLSSPKETEKFLRLKLIDIKTEVFCCLFLDTRHRVIAFEELFHGTIDGATVYPRVIAQRCLELNAAAVILAHNHPSGTAEPSLADQVITRRVKEALALLDIQVLDHFVIGDNEPTSMAQRGML